MNAYPVICRFKFRLLFHKLLENHMFTAQYVMKHETHRGKKDHAPDFKDGIRKNIK